MRTEVLHADVRAPPADKEKPKEPAVKLDAQPTTSAPVTLPPTTPVALEQSVDVSTWPTPVLEKNARALQMQLAKAPKSVTAADRDRLLKIEGELSKRYAAENSSTATSTPGKVEMCERPADLPLNGTIGLTHRWLKTSNKEAGMGLAGGGVPGHKGGPSGYPGAPTTMNDHTGEIPTSCTPLEKVDADCVDRELEIGKSTGRWTPPFNDCHTVVSDIVKKCATDGVDPFAHQSNKENDAGVP